MMLRAPSKKERYYGGPDSRTEPLMMILSDFNVATLGRIPVSLPFVTQSYYLITILDCSE